jgi:hypothetical protein
MCGTGVDFVAYRAENKAYNERIFAAYAAGSLKRFSLKHKLRGANAVRKLFATARLTRLAKDGDMLDVADGKYKVTYHYEVFEDGSAGGHVTLARAACEAQFVRLFYPTPYHDRPGTLWTTYAPGPFEALVADDATTAILRDAERYAWVIDLPRAIIVQVVGPIG